MERNLVKAFVIVIAAAVGADILTHGNVAVALGNIGAGILRNSFQAAAGQNITGA